jgi:hypothetical protein
VLLHRSRRVVVLLAPMVALLTVPAGQALAQCSRGGQQQNSLRVGPGQRSFRTGAGQNSFRTGSGQQSALVGALLQQQQQQSALLTALMQQNALLAAALQQQNPQPALRRQERPAAGLPDDPLRQAGRLVRLEGAPRNLKDQQCELATPEGPVTVFFNEPPVRLRMILREQPDARAVVEGTIRVRDDRPTLIRAKFLRPAAPVEAAGRPDR